MLFTAGLTVNNFRLRCMIMFTYLINILAKHYNVSKLFLSSGLNRLYQGMAFIKEGLNAFLGQPIERKRSDHRLKSVDSNIDPRAWALDCELRRQHFLNVVRLAGDGGGGDGGDGEGGVAAEDAKHEIPIRLVRGGVTENNNILIQNKIQILESDKEFWKNVVADKENEIEQLLYQIHAMTEDLQALLGHQGTDPRQQKAPLGKRRSNHRNSMQIGLERLQDHVEKMKEKLNEANNTIAYLQRNHG